MDFNITAAKAALREAGHPVSQGAYMNAADLHELSNFAWFRFGLTRNQISSGLAYPAQLPSNFPGCSNGQMMAHSPEQPQPPEQQPVPPEQEEQEQTQKEPGQTQKQMPGQQQQTQP